MTPPLTTKNGVIETWVSEAVLASVGLSGPGVGPYGPRSARLVLAERPMHGYELITELEARSSGGGCGEPGFDYPDPLASKNRGLSRLRVS